MSQPLLIDFQVHILLLPDRFNVIQRFREPSKYDTFVSQGPVQDSTNDRKRYNSLARFEDIVELFLER